MADLDTKGFKKVGTGYIKTQVKEVSSASAGQEVFIGGKGFPPYVVPTRYWMNLRMVGTANSSPNAAQDYSVRGIAVPLTRSQGTSAAGQDLMEKFGDPFADPIDWQQATVLFDLGIQGGLQEYTSWYKDRQVFQRGATLALPERAVFSADGNVRYVDQWSQKGAIMSPWAVDEPKFFGVGYTTNIPVYDTAVDWDAILWGNQTKIPAFTELVVNEFLDPTQETGIAVGTHFRDADFINWSSNGHGTTDASVADTIVEMGMRVRLTIKYDVYIPEERAGGFQVITVN